MMKDETDITVSASAACLMVEEYSDFGRESFYGISLSDQWAPNVIGRLA